MTVRAAFQAQGKACLALGSPFMGRLMALLSENLQAGTPVADRVLGWAGDPRSSADSVPLRLAGALHALKIEGLALGDVYPPHQVDDDTLWAGLEAAMHDHAARILDWLDSPPQTNEVRRSAALIAALSVVAEHYSKPVELLELGCSGGLNLCADKFCLSGKDVIFGPPSSSVRMAPDWEGSVPVTQPLPIVARRGVDLSPIDPTQPEGRLKLLAYLWPDQPERMEMTKAAIGIARQTPTEISAGDAGEWTERVLANPAPGCTRVLFHTVAWQYFPKATKSRALQAIKHHSGPLVRFAMEADGGRGARLTLTHYPSGQTQELGRADFHGRWVDWRG